MAPLLRVSDLEVKYDSVQVLFGVDFEIETGEVVALLGTNGAGKSTILKAISGLVPASAGKIELDGQDITGMAAHKVCALGLVQAPGGAGVFPSLTVRENLRIAAWLQRRDDDASKQATERALDKLHELRGRLGQPAGNLSGGEQQMLTMAMAFLAQPKLLMIDELSLGLAPIVVERLLGVVEAIRDQGTAIVLVEQSVNVALTVARRAYFLEKGEVQFSGPTAELLERPDVLRSVFLEGASSLDTRAASPAAGRRSRRSRGNGGVATATGDPVLQLRGLSRAFGGVVAVDEVDLDVAPSEIVGLIGPNGAGKTTIFDLVSGFLPPSRGTITFDGTEMTHMNPYARARLGLGRSFQDARLFPGLTVAETIAVGIDGEADVHDPVAIALRVSDAVASEKRVAERVDDLVERMGLGAFRDKYIAELSTGTRRIVDLACIVGRGPRVILFDEPSSGIAQREAESLGPLLSRMRDETGAALLVIEHDMPLVCGVADRLVALDLGRVVTTGTPKEVVNHPAVVESYIGTRPEVVQRSGVTTTTRRARSRGRAKA